MKRLQAVVEGENQRSALLSGARWRLEKAGRPTDGPEPFTRDLNREQDRGIHVLDSLEAGPHVQREGRADGGCSRSWDTPVNAPKPCGRSRGRPQGAWSGPAPRFPDLKEVARVQGCAIAAATCLRGRSHPVRAGRAGRRSCGWSIRRPCSAWQLSRQRRRCARRALPGLARAARGAITRPCAYRGWLAHAGTAAATPCLAQRPPPAAGVVRRARACCRPGRTGISVAGAYGWHVLRRDQSWSLDAYLRPEALQILVDQATAVANQADEADGMPVLLRTVEGDWPFPSHYQLVPQPLAALDLLDLLELVRTYRQLHGDLAGASEPRRVPVPGAPQPDARRRAPGARVIVAAQATCETRTRLEDLTQLSSF